MQLEKFFTSDKDFESCEVSESDAVGAFDSLAAPVGDGAATFGVFWAKTVQRHRLKIAKTARNMRTIIILLRPLRSFVFLRMYYAITS